MKAKAPRKPEAQAPQPEGVEAVVRLLCEHGVRARIEGDKLVLIGRVPHDIRAAVRAHRAEIIAGLREVEAQKGKARRVVAAAAVVGGDVVRDTLTDARGQTVTNVWHRQTVRRW